MCLLRNQWLEKWRLWPQHQYSLYFNFILYTLILTKATAETPLCWSWEVIARNFKICLSQDHSAISIPKNILTKMALSVNIYLWINDCEGPQPQARWKAPFIGETLTAGLTMDFILYPLSNDPEWMYWVDMDSQGVQPFPCTTIWLQLLPIHVSLQTL